MYIGIDLGTSEVKVMIINALGEIIAKQGSPLKALRPHARWSEQDPQSWWDATNKAMVALKESHPEVMKKVVSIGLSGQMHGAVLLDENDHVLRPCILWNDTRADLECQELMQNTSNFLDLAGNLAMPGFTAPKLLWVQKHEPEIFARIATVLLPKDYLRLLLTGKKISDPSDAAGTLWLDVAKRDWSDVLLNATGLTRAHMPDLVEGNTISGELMSDLYDPWGLNFDTPVIVAGGASDNAASAIGIGAINSGDGFISLGTSGVLFVVNDQYRPNPESATHAFCHALPNKWHQMGVMLSAASAFAWLARLLNSNEQDLLNALDKKLHGLTSIVSNSDNVNIVDNTDNINYSDNHDDLNEVKEPSIPNVDTNLTKERYPNNILNAPIFLPYLSGERTPHNDPFAVGVFHGLTHDTDCADLTYSVLEGVAFGLADCLAALNQAGTEVTELSLVGGGAVSNFWAQLIADVLNVRIITHLGGESGGALGAARLGYLAQLAHTQQVAIHGIAPRQTWLAKLLSLFKEKEEISVDKIPSIESICVKPPIAQIFTPNQIRHAALKLRLADFRALYVK